MWYIHDYRLEYKMENAIKIFILFKNILDKTAKICYYHNVFDRGAAAKSRSLIERQSRRSGLFRWADIKYMSDCHDLVERCRLNIKSDICAS